MQKAKCSAAPSTSTGSAPGICEQGIPELLSFGRIMARPNAVRRLKRIAVVGLGFLSDGVHPLQRALAQNFRRRPEWQLIFLAEASVDAFKLLAKTHCDGVLARVTTPEMAVAARRLACPLVNFSTLMKFPGVPTVRRDDRGIAAMCARHLLERGYSRFGVVQVPFKDWCFHEYADGFLEAVGAAGRPVEISHHTLDAEPPSQGESAVSANGCAR